MGRNCKKINEKYINYFKSFKKVLRQVFKFFILSLVINVICIMLETQFFVEYLKSNLLTIQLGALAINISINTLILTKTENIKLEFPEFNSESIIISLKNSIKEQIILIILGLALLVLFNSNLKIEWIYYDFLIFIIQTLLIATFINTIQVLYDTSIGLFDMSQLYNKLKK